MDITLNQTVSHLKSLMARVKDVVFPQYSDADPDYALSVIRAELSAVSNLDTAKAFIAELPEIRRLLATDVDAIAKNDPAVVDEQDIVFCYPAVTAMLVTSPRFASIHFVNELITAVIRSTIGLIVEFNASPVAFIAPSTAL